MTPEAKALIERIAKWKLETELLGSSSLPKEDFDWYVANIGMFDGVRMNEGMLRGDDLKDG